MRGTLNGLEHEKSSDRVQLQRVYDWKLTRHGGHEEDVDLFEVAALDRRDEPLHLVHLEKNEQVDFYEDDTFANAALRKETKELRLDIKMNSMKTQINPLSNKSFLQTRTSSYLQHHGFVRQLKKGDSAFFYLEL